MVLYRLNQTDLSCRFLKFTDFCRWRRLGVWFLIQLPLIETFQVQRSIRCMYFFHWLFNDTCSKIHVLPSQRHFNSYTREMPPKSNLDQFIFMFESLIWYPFTVFRSLVATNNCVFIILTDFFFILFYFYLFNLFCWAISVSGVKWNEIPH